MKESIKHWAKALLAAFVTGASSSFLSVLGISGAQMVGVQVQQLNPKQLLISTLFGGLVGAAAYLKQSPVAPDAPNVPK